jgi:hypothetical protein
MSKINFAMLKRITASFGQVAELPPEFSKILSRGFFEFEGHCFLKFYENRINRSDLAGMIARFHDSTGLECWVNDIDIDPREYEAHLQIGLIFAAKLVEKWKRSTLYRPAVVLVSSNDTLTNIKFHLKRTNESWFADDIEGYGPSKTSGICILEI